MLSDITIGQYYKGDSVVHKMDARAKIIFTVLFVVMIFLCKNFLSLGLVGAFVLLSILACGVPFRVFFRSLKPIVPVVIFTAILNIFYISGGDWEIPLFFGIKITEKGVWTAVFMAVRIVFLIIASSILTYTTVPTMLTDAIEKLFSPLKLFKIPVNTLAMMMTLALRFIPTLIEEIEKITNAQKARGADFESGKFMDRVKAVVPILIPLFVSSFRRAYELSFAMSCRCYTGGEGRTRMKKMKLHLRDGAGLLFFALGITGVVLLNHYFGAVI